MAPTLLFPLIDVRGRVVSTFDDGADGVTRIDQCVDPDLVRYLSPTELDLPEAFFGVSDWQLFVDRGQFIWLARWHGDIASMHAARAISAREAATIYLTLGCEPPQLVLEAVSSEARARLANERATELAVVDPSSEATDLNATAAASLPPDDELNVKARVGMENYGLLPPRSFILGDKHADLTKLRYRLMECLLRHERHTATARKVCMELWDDEEAESTSLRPLISRTNERFVEREMDVTISVEAGYVKLAIGQDCCKKVANAATEMQPNCNRP